MVARCCASSAGVGDARNEHRSRRASVGVVRAPPRPLAGGTRVSITPCVASNHKTQYLSAFQGATRLLAIVASYKKGADCLKTSREIDYA